MKRLKKKRDTDNINQVLNEVPNNVDETPIEDMADVNSIEEFLELKKLQNRVLGKMLEKINQSEDQDKLNK
jgi:hypothetical protein